MSKTCQFFQNEILYLSKQFEIMIEKKELDLIKAKIPKPRIKSIQEKLKELNLNEKSESHISRFLGGKWETPDFEIAEACLVIIKEYNSKRNEYLQELNNSISDEQKSQDTQEDLPS